MQERSFIRIIGVNNQANRSVFRSIVGTSLQSAYCLKKQLFQLGMLSSTTNVAGSRLV